MRKKKTDALVTKNYLTRRLGLLEERLDYKVGKRFKEFKNDMIVMKDEIIKEVKDMREEFNTHQYSHSRIDETLENHEARLKKLKTL